MSRKEQRQRREKRLPSSPDAASYFQTAQEAEAFFRTCGIEDAAADAWYLMEYVTGMSRTSYLLRRQETMEPEQREKYWRMVRRRGEHIPLQHLTGVQEFMGFPFRVNEHVLVPRQDTETLAVEALSCLRKKKKEKDTLHVLDLCTGSGCIAISLKKLCPAALVTGSDISPEALAVSEENGISLGAEVNWVRSDLFARLEGVYDVIVSNPPYIRTAVIETLSEEVRCHEPHQALDGHEDGLHFYRRIISEAGNFLRPGGWLLFEIGYDQGEAVTELMRRNGFQDVKVIKDLAGLDRVVSGHC